MFICGRRCVSIQDEGGLATRDGTHLSPLYKIRVRNAHWTRRLRVEDRMCLLPPPLSSSSAWKIPTSQPAQSNERSGGHNKHTPWHALWRNHHTSPITVSIDRELPHQMSCHRCFVPSTALQHIWCGDSTHRKVRRICSQKLLTRKHPYLAQVTDTCAPIGNPIPPPPLI